MKKLWQKNNNLLSSVEAFETTADLVVDQKLIKSDVLGSLGHGLMLVKIGIITQSEYKKVASGLRQIIVEAQNGKFTLKLGDEDVHTKIEQYLTHHCGAVGKKIHTGRSRNDQVLTAIRLYTKEQLLQVGLELVQLAKLFIDFAEAHEFIHMPGYTHMQKAMPASVGMWAGAFAESLLDDLQILKTAYELNDQSPLGSGAGYGVPLTLDRKLTAQLLGFKKIQNNSLYCQNSRGKIEVNVVNALISILATVNRFASDCMLFTTAEFGFFTASDQVTTGSSIMPQKKNVDLAELIRSKVHLVAGNYVSLLGVSTNLVSGYNRDLQDSKKLLIDSLNTTYQVIGATQLLLTHIAPQKNKLATAMTKELFATHLAIDQVQKGIPFRDAYKQVAANLSAVPEPDETTIATLLRKSNHAGGTGNLQLDKVKRLLTRIRRYWQQEQNAWLRVTANLLTQIN